MKWIACTRMYDVTPEVRGHWHALMATAAEAADLAIECIEHPPPAPLTDLWTRDDLALAFMCGFPLATSYPAVRPLAAPVAAGSNDDRPTYRSVWVVRADSDFENFETLASTFGHRIGWTVVHSHSGFNAPRHALLAYRTATRPRLYRESVGPLGDPRTALANLADHRIDVSAIDSYWWWLLERHDPATAAGFRAIGETASAPMPPLIASARLPESAATRLGAALAALHDDPGLRPRLGRLGIRRFARVTRADYAPLIELDRVARAADYPVPA